MKIRIHYSLFHFFVAFLTIASCCSCSTKRNTAASRQWQSFNTRYNVYFNGKEHFDETLAEMEKNYEDDFSKQLLMHPAEALADPHYPQPSGDFTRSIEKMQKAIQLHSITRKPAKRTTSQKEKEFRAREEFNPFLHNAWMVLGKSQYYNGDFTGAAATFLYITKHFYWLPEVVTEARLWMARSYCALDWKYEVENAIHPIKETDLTNKNLLQLYNFVMADFLIRKGLYGEASNFLKFAAENSSGVQSHRLWFLLGQINELAGDTTGAYMAFKKAANGISIPYRTKFNARIKQSEVYPGNNIIDEVKSLRSLLKYERNNEYADQIYYAIGNLYLSQKDTTEAIKNYKLAIKNSLRQSTDYAMAQLALGNIFFSLHDYYAAQPCYEKALPFLSANYPNYIVLKKRSDVLDELAIYSGNILLQDSLLALSKLSHSEQVKIAERYIKDLQLKEKEEKEAEEREKFNSTLPIDKQHNTSSIPAFISSNDNSWYFYNQAIKNIGKTEFQKKWGSRKLEDDWRRKNKTGFLFEDNEENEQKTDADSFLQENEHRNVNDSTIKDLKDANDPHTIEYYLNQIPKTPEEIENSNSIIKESLYNVALILKDKLEDYPAARQEFLKLLNRYPGNDFSLDVYYNLYLMASRIQDKTEAESWRQKIIQDFPDSDYGQVITDPQYFENLQKMYIVEDKKYQQAYEAYIENNNDLVHELTQEMIDTYPISDLLPKFLFIDGLAYFTDGNNEKFKENLNEILQRWPDADVSELSSAILNKIKEGGVLLNNGTNVRGMIWKIKLGDENSETEEIKDEIFVNDPDSPHFLVLVYPLDSINPNQLLFDVAKFNFSTFQIKDFDLEQMSFTNLGLLIIKGFENLHELELYRTALERSDFEMSEEVAPVMITKQNFETILGKGLSFEDYFRFQDSLIEDQ